MKTLKLLAVSAMVVISLLLGVQSTSHALTLGFNDFVNPVFFVADGSLQDANSLIGVVTYIGTIGAWTVNVTTGLSKPIIGSAAVPQLDLNSVNVTTLAAGHLRFGVVDSGFTGPISGGIAGPFIFEAGGTTGGSVSFDAFYDPANGELFFGNIFASLGPFSGGAFSGTTSGSFAAGGPFSLGIIGDVTHGGAATTSFDADLRVPEPGILILLGIGLGAVGVLSRRIKF